MIIYTETGFGIAFAALTVSLANILYTLMGRHTGKPQNRMYIAIVGIIAVNSVCEIVNCTAANSIKTSDTAFAAFKLSQYIYFLTHTLLAPMFFFYVSYVTGRLVGIKLKRGNSGGTLNFLLDTVPVFVVWVSEIFLAVNPVFHHAWSYDADRNFHREWGEYLVVYGFSALWTMLSFFVVMRSWRILSKNRKNAIAVSFLLVEGGILAQMLLSSMRIEVLMEAVGFTSVLLFIENEDDRKNVELNVYNPAAFALDLSAYLKNNIPLNVMIIRGIRFNKTANTVVSGKIDRDAINSAAAEFLCTKIKRWYVYSIGHGRFALTVFNKSEDEVHALAEDILARFKEPWQIEGEDIYLTAKVMIVDIPGRTKTLDEVLYISECPIPDTMHTQIFEGYDLDWIVRHSAVENAVAGGLRNGSFDVYYQPTYSIDKKIHGAEALLRMRDEELGMVFPDEFIPIAEQIGIIDDLDDFVLKEVCKFVMTGFPQKHGMECINVNLSVLECMKEGFAEHISGIVSEAGVHKKLINFEITESVAAKDYGHLSSVIDQLKKEGFLFSIDDYGTGYSNMTALFSLGADIIKIDKSVLWNSCKSDLGMTLLKTSVDMVHKMNKKALMEGVETEEQIEVLKKLDCDYLQGYYFSKPLPQKEFIEFIEKTCP